MNQRNPNLHNTTNQRGQNKTTPKNGKGALVKHQPRTPLSQQVINSNNQNAARTSRNRRRRQERRKQPNTRMPAIQPCTLDYAYCLLDPFGCNVGVCVPDIHVIDSQKFRGFARGSFTAGTNGTGFIVHNPHHACRDTVLLRLGYQTGDGYIPVSPIVTNSPTYTSENIAPEFASDGSPSSLTIGHLMSNLPYDNADFRMAPYNSSLEYGDKQVRVVASGIRIRYTGPTLNMGGSLILYREPDNESLMLTANGSGYITFDDLLASPYCLRRPVSRKWSEVTWKPVTAEDYTYSPNAINGRDTISYITGFASGGTVDVLDIPSSPKWSYGICITGAVAGAAFDYEVYTHYEFVGQIATKTKSHSDINGVSMVRNVMPDAPSMVPSQTLATRIVKELTSPAMMDMAVSAGKYVLPIIGALL